MKRYIIHKDGIMVGSADHVTGITKVVGMCRQHYYKLPNTSLFTFKGNEYKITDVLAESFYEEAMKVYWDNQISNL